VELRERMFAHRSLSLYGGHDDEINCLVFSHDLEILLTASIQGFIRLWNTVIERLTFKIQEKTGMLTNKAQRDYIFI
jgi:WD40 repeat protein